MRNGKSRSWLDRRHVMGILVAGAAMVFTAGAMAAPDEAARKLLPDDIKQKGLLIAAMPLDFEPFNYLDAQNAQMGLDVGPPRWICWDYAAFAFPFPQRFQIDRAVFFSLNAKDPLRHAVAIIPHLAARIQHRIFDESL